MKRLVLVDEHAIAAHAFLNLLVGQQSGVHLGPWLSNVHCMPASTENILMADRESIDAILPCATPP